MRSIISVMFVFLTAPFGHAQDKHSIKFKIDTDVGKRITYRSFDISTGSMKFFRADGKLVSEHKNERSETSYRTTVFERDKDGTATKFVRAYDKALKKESGNTKTLSYRGRTLLFEKRDGKFRIGVIDEPPLDAKRRRKAA